MRYAPALLGAAALAGTCSAQVGTGVIWYEASADEGQTWVRDRLLTSPQQPSVLVRVRAAWSNDAGYAFDGTMFDLTISDAASDSVSEMIRPPNGVIQTIVATRFGSTIKIDDSRDTLPPGEGRRGIFPSQLPEVFWGTNFSTSNPLTLFQFRLTFGATSIRTLAGLYFPPSGGDTISRYMWVYTPAPGPLTALTLGLTPAYLRRRR